VNLIMPDDDAIPEQTALSTSQNNACNAGLRNIRDTQGFFDPARRPYFHYSLWVHNLAPNDTTSGIQCPGTRDFIVSLGSWTSSTGTDIQQSGTFMHELGHALGLGHGGGNATTQTGDAAINYKPNYLSVMNYQFQATGIFDGATAPPVAHIDYSRRDLPTLRERPTPTATALDENAGISDATDQTAWFDPTGALRAGDGNTPLDWNWSTSGLPPFEGNVSVDINGDSQCIGAGGDGTLQTTAGGDDTPNTAGTAIIDGPDGACQTITIKPGSDDVVLIKPDSPCVATGRDDVLTTTPKPGSDDPRLRRWIGVGADLVCDTTAATGDLQATPVGQSEPTVPLTGFEDWPALDYSDGLGGVGKPLRVATGATHADITASQAQALEAFWRDAATIPGVTVAPQAPLTSPVVAHFTEAVEAVTADNVVLRRDGAPQPLPVTRTCKDAAGGVVGCASRVVASAELRPGSPLVPGEHYKVTVNPAGVRPVTDPAGNAVAATQLPFRGSLTESERSAAARYEWQPVATPQALGGSYTRDHLRGATASFGFTGTAVTWYTVTGPDQGQAKVFIDGTLRATLDQYATTTSYQVPKTFGGLAAGSHTITIEATGQGNPAASGTFVSVDAFRVGENLVDGDYTWQPNTALDQPRMGYVRSDLKAAQVAFTFRGTGVTLWTVQGPSHGKFTVLIDGGQAGRFDGYKATTMYAVPIRFGGLTDDVHTITVVVAGQARAPSTGTFVAVDGWSVQ
jgi:hypothetical protein